jgi:outer membrane protein assembly factor BamC
VKDQASSIFRLSALGILMVLAGCSVLEGDKIDYKSAGKAPTLEVPPDLTQLTRDTRYAVPGGAVTASGFAAGQAAAATQSGGTVATTALGDVRVERAGTTRYLVVKRPPEALWDPVRAFWLENGFLLAIDNPKLGIMETDWAENRAKIPQDPIRATLGKLLDSVYSTPERDKFRTRIERTPDGSTEIYISHRGMIEVYTNNATRENTIWQPRPADPELENEFLRRLMIKLGVTQEQAQAALAAAAPQSAARLVTLEGNMPAVEIDDGFDRAWRRVGLALDRTGFTVEDRDRSKGLYFVRYVAPDPNRKEPGFLAKLFGSDEKNTSATKYQIQVAAAAKGSVVRLLDAQGRPAPADAARNILKIVADELK